MNSLFRFVAVLIFTAAWFLSADSRAAVGQAEQQLTTEILRRDELFWKAFNECDLEEMRNTITDDIEFYHDKGGATFGSNPFVESLKRGLCHGDRPKLRREAVAETERVFPLRKGDDIYGAIMSGEHVFYSVEPDKSDRLDSRANFTHLWLKQGDEYRISRVFSYNHRPGSLGPPPTEIKLSYPQLDRFVGAYQGAHSGRVTVSRDGDALVLGNDKNQFRLHPNSENTFFIKDRNVTFDFQKQGDGNASIVVRENGAVVEELSFEP